MTHILITSASKKIPLINAVREASRRLFEKSLIIGADSDPHCVGRYFIDKFWEMPPVVDLSVSDLIAYCQKEKVRFIIPTRDGELPFFSTHKKTLEAHGIFVMISSSNGIAIADDKYRFSQIVEWAIPTQLELGQERNGPYVVKERHGAGSRSIGCRLTWKQAVAHAQILREPVFQPFIEGTEVSCDLYIRKDGKAHGVVCRERNLVVDGESQVTTTFQDQELEKRCASLAAKLNLYGHVMFQYIRETASGNVFLIECNPRFGGASTASLRVGLDSFFWFLKEASNEPLPPFVRSQQEARMIRHAEDTFIVC